VKFPTYQKMKQQVMRVSIKIFTIFFITFQKEPFNELWLPNSSTRQKSTRISKCLDGQLNSIAILYVWIVI